MALGRSFACFNFSEGYLTNMRKIISFIQVECITTPQPSRREKCVHAFRDKCLYALFYMRGYEFMRLPMCFPISVWLINWYTVCPKLLVYNGVIKVGISSHFCESPQCQHLPHGTWHTVRYRFSMLTSIVSMSWARAYSRTSIKTGRMRDWYQESMNSTDVSTAMQLVSPKNCNRSTLEL